MDKFIRVFLVLCLLPFYMVFSQTTAITEDGRKVLLKPDGTWEYVQDSTYTGNDFRNVRWGMTIKEVKDRETAVFVTEGDVAGEHIIMYKESLTAGSSTYNVGIYYIFAKGILVRAKYVLDETYVNKNLYFVPFNSFKDVLTQKYGEPKSDNTAWTNDLYRDDPSNYGLAVSIGHLNRLVSWETPRTKVFLGILGENFEVKVHVEYQSVEFKKLEDKVKKKTAESQF